MLEILEQTQSRAFCQQYLAEQCQRAHEVLAGMPRVSAPIAQQAFSDLETLLFYIREDAGTLEGQEGRGSPCSLLADLWLCLLHGADKRGTTSSQCPGLTRFNHFHHHKTNDHQDREEVRRQIERIRGKRPDCDKHHRYQQQRSYQEQLVREGKVIYVGSSNFAGWQMVQANELARSRHFLGLVCEEGLYNLTARTVELEVLPAC
jgi:hypothetical protein